MDPYLQMTIGYVGLSLILVYSIWVPLRVWHYRQDLFEIRDRMWDEMRQLGAIDDAAHKEVRTTINGLIRCAPALSLLLVCYLAQTRKSAPAAVDIPEPVRQALSEVRQRTQRFVVWESLFAWFLILLMSPLLFILVPMRITKKMLAAAMEPLNTLFNSGTAASLPAEC
jgi:hypothetical protein